MEFTITRTDTIDLSEEDMRDIAFAYIAKKTGLYHGDTIEDGYIIREFSWDGFPYRRPQEPEKDRIRKATPEDEKTLEFYNYLKGL